MNLARINDVLSVFVRKAEVPAWKQLHKIADSAIPAYESLFLLSLARMKNAVDLDEMAGAIQDKSMKRVMDSIPWERFDVKMEDAKELSYALVISGGSIASKELVKTLKKVRKAEDDSFNLSFNMRNPKAVTWTKDHVGNMITQVGDETKLAVKNVVTSAFETGGHPYEQARKIRESIGLTNRQMSSVQNYQTLLDMQGRSQTQVDRMVDTYVNKQIRKRANTIARTETIDAACGGQQLHWEDMIDKGYLDKDEMKKEWDTTPDDKLCAVCQALDGEQVEIDAAFSWGGKQPTRHPKCRCSTILVEVQPIEEYEPSAEEEPSIIRSGHMDEEEFEEDSFNSHLRYLNGNGIDPYTGIPNTDYTAKAKVTKRIEEEIQAVIDYTDGDYGAIRSGELKKNAKRLESLIETSPKYDGTIYRGITVWEDDPLLAVKSGKVIDMRGISSWSSEKDIANGFTFEQEGPKVVFELKKTNKGASIKHLSGEPTENEVLVSGKARFKVVSNESTMMEYEKGKFPVRKIVLEEVEETEIVKPVIAEIKPGVKTVQDAERWAKENLGLKSVSYKDMDVKLADRINSHLADLKKTYNAPLEKIKVGSPGTGGKSAIAEFDSNTKTLTLNKKYFKDEKTVDKIAEEYQADGYTVKGSKGFESMISHEYGHAVDMRLPQSFYADVGKLMREKGTKVIEKEVSKYATSQLKEFVAESFSGYVGGNKSKTIVEFGKLLEKHLKGVKI